VADLLGVSTRALQHWLAWYRRGGLEAVLARRHGGFRTTYNAKLSASQQEALRHWTRQGRCFRVAEAQAWVLQQFGISYSYWGMWELLHRLRLRPKRPRSQSAKANSQAQAAWREGAHRSACAARGATHAAVGLGG
jgi:transposase